MTGTEASTPARSPLGPINIMPWEVDMGSWGIDAFANDTAGDWAFGLDGLEDYSLVEETLDKVLASKDDCVDATCAEEGLAAAEAVARAKGAVGFSNSYTESVDEWAKRTRSKPTVALVEKALAAIDRILMPTSELLELWEDTAETDSWKESVNELRSRVRG